MSLYNRRTFRDWAGLPADIVDLFVIKLDRFNDYIRFCGVCTKWRCVALEANVDHRSNLVVLKASDNKLPMLLFNTNENDEELRSLFCVSDGKTYAIKLPIPYKYRFAGSSLGWLFCVQKNMEVTLVNPLNNRCISLPVFGDPPPLFLYLGMYSDYYIRKGILISDPSVSPHSFGVVVLYMNKLAFFKSGASYWNFIKSELRVSDIIYYKDKLYGISFWGKFVQIDLDSRTIKTIIGRTEPYPVGAIYLVESQDGELLMVKLDWNRPESSYVGGDPDVEDHSDNELNEDENYGIDNISDSDSETVLSDSADESSDDDDDDYGPKRSYEFKVFKMAQTKESPTWEEINNIGEQALFVGNNHSVSVSTTDFPGCMPNSIYYTTEQNNYFYPYPSCSLKDDSGIFNLGNGRIYNHHVLDSSYKYVHQPIWFVPKP